MFRVFLECEFSLEKKRGGRSSSSPAVQSISRSSIQETDEKPASPRRPSVSRRRSEAAYIGALLIIASFIVLGPALGSNSALLFFFPPYLHWTGVILIGTKHLTAGILLLFPGIIIAVTVYYILLMMYFTMK